MYQYKSDFVVINMFKPSSIFWPCQGGVSIVDQFAHLPFVFVILSCLFLSACDHLLGKGCALGSVVCDVFL